MDPVEFGRLIRDLRKEMGLTLMELSNASGVSQPYLSHIENGKRGIPSPDILRKLSEPLDVAYELLMEKAGYLLNLESHISATETRNEFTEILSLLHKRPVEVTLIEEKYEQYLDGNPLTIDTFPELMDRHSDRWANELWKDLYNLARRESELTHYLQNEGVTLNGHQLTAEDRQRVSDMLKLMFPEYSQK